MDDQVNEGMILDNQQPSVGIPQEWATMLQDGPDGTKWVGVQISLAGGAFVVGMPVDMAKKLLIDLPGMLHESISQAQRANSGLVIATDNALSVLTQGRLSHDARSQS